MKVRPGYTLVEVVVAILLCAVMISSVFSVALTGKQGGRKNERRLAAAQAAQSMLQKLKNYVASDPNNSLIAGPGASAPGQAGWSLNTAPYADSRGNVYALAQGTHRITGPGVLPAELAGPPYNGYLEYSVSWTPSAASCPPPPPSLPANCQPSVSVSVNWTEP